MGYDEIILQNAINAFCFPTVTVKGKSADSIVLSLSKTWQLLITLQQLPQAAEIKLNESEIHLGLVNIVERKRWVNIFYSNADVNSDC